MKSKITLFIFALMLVFNMTSCIRVTHVDGDKKEAARQEKLREEGKRDPTADDMGKALLIIFSPFIILGGLVVLFGGNDDRYGGGPRPGTF